MNLVRWVGSVGALGMFACSCGGGGGPSSLEHKGDSGSLSATNPDTSGRVTRDLDAGASNPGVAYSVTLTMSGFTVPPGGEAWKCQDFANPFGGQQVDVRTWNLAMNAGSHHLTLFNVAGATDGPIVDCPNGVANANSYSFGGQSEKLAFTYPDGVGEAIPAGIGFTMNSHYVNTTSKPIQASVVVTIFVAAPGVVTQHAGTFDALLYSISVPPTAQPVTVGSSCKLPQDMNLVAVAGHMHERASDFITTSGGTTLLETSEWSGSPPKLFSPPLPLKAGADLTWSCVYTNETGAPLAYGPSALTNVMCNTVLSFYPIQDISNPVISCIQ
jgi:hypothetical protein